jgi:hypothetical protein
LLINTTHFCQTGYIGLILNGELFTNLTNNCFTDILI